MVFYGAFDDQLNAMDAILNGKESFALQVMLCSHQMCFFWNSMFVISSSLWMYATSIFAVLGGG